MRRDRRKAELLRKQGFSYQSITNKLSIPKSTLATWFSQLPWSSKIRHTLSINAQESARQRMTAMSHRARKNRELRYRQRRIEAQRSFPVYKNDLLFIAGLVIYWCEGDNKITNGIVRATNTDPVMLRIFFRFLKKYLKVPPDRVRAYLVLYPDLHENTCLRFWSQSIGLPQKAFFRSNFIKGRHLTKKISHGICTVMTANRELKELLLEWLKCYKTLHY